MEIEAPIENIEEEIDYANLSPEDALLLAHTQLFKLTEIVGKQHDVIERLAELTKGYQDRLVHLENQNLIMQTNLSNIVNKIEFAERQPTVMMPTGMMNSPKDAIQSLCNTERNRANGGFYDVLIATIESVKLMFEQLPESDRAEILSKMAVQINGPLPQYIYDIPYSSYSKILEEAAKIVDQPTSILSLYK